MPVNIKRLSDNKLHKQHVDPNHVRVGEVKTKIRAEFAPQFPNGCKLLFNGKVLKSIHRLKHYGIADNGTIDMDDRKNWSSSSSASNSED